MTSPAWRVVPARRMTEAMAAAHDAGHCIEAQWADMVAAAPRPDYDAMAREIFSGADLDWNGNMTIAELKRRLRGYFEGE